MASAQVPGSADLPAIAAAAGNTAFDARRWEDGVLYVDGVSQEALDAAVASVGTAPSASDNPVPLSVTGRQARLALHSAGLLDAAEAAIASAPQPAQIEWRHGTTIDRASPLVVEIGGALDLSAAQIDDLFRAAAAL